MARARRRVRPGHERVTALQLAYLRDEWRPSEPVPEGSDPAERFFWGQGALLSLPAAWAVARDDVLADWIADRPGTRPPVWWELEALTMRRRLGGVGTPLHECLADAPRYDCGVPVDWLSQELASYYTGELRHVVTGERVNPGAKPEDFPYPPVDVANPPTYESEAVYLERHGQLTRAEQQLFDASQLDVQPESILGPEECADVQPTK